MKSQSSRMTQETKINTFSAALSGAGVYGLNCEIFGMKEYSHLFMLGH